MVCGQVDMAEVVEVGQQRHHDTYSPRVLYGNQGVEVDGQAHQVARVVANGMAEAEARHFDSSLHAKDAECTNCTIAVSL